MFQHQRYQLLYFDEVVLPFSKETQFLYENRHWRFMIDFTDVFQTQQTRRTWTIDVTHDLDCLKKENMMGKLYFLKGRDVHIVTVKDCLLETYRTDELYSSFLFRFPSDIEFDHVILDLHLNGAP